MQSTTMREWDRSSGAGTLAERAIRQAAQACGGVGARIDAQPYCGSEDLNFFGAHLPMWVADVRYFMTSANLPVLECFSAVVLMPSTRQERDAKESMVRSL
eukprot:6770419-Prymnesium_polylepis.1